MRGPPTLGAEEKGMAHMYIRENQGGNAKRVVSAFGREVCPTALCQGRWK